MKAMASRLIPAPDNLSPKISPFWHRIFPVNIDIAVKTILGVWAAYMFANIVRATMWSPQSHNHSLEYYIITAVISITVTWALYRLLLKAGESLTLAVIILTVPTIFLALATVFVSNSLLAYPAPMLEYLSASHNIPLEEAHTFFFDAAFTNYLIFLGWGGLYLAMANSRNTEIALVHSRNLERLTRGSEIRALRYQISPHFLFNALNSVSCLIMDKQNGQAERLIDLIADYMRSVLYYDGEDIITVEKEVAQQIRYLEIEQVRFPSRLQFEVNISEDARQWKIPSLILQPLIENAVKHGVAQTSVPVCITISATIESGRLKLTVTNTGRVSVIGSKAKGTGTGLSNVRERLEALYGPAAALITGNGLDDVVIATIIVPSEDQIFKDYAL
jgi:two-component system LytT family sensor kinase